MQFVQLASGNLSLDATLGNFVGWQIGNLVPQSHVSKYCTEDRNKKYLLTLGLDTNSAPPSLSNHLPYHSEG